MGVRIVPINLPEEWEILRGLLREYATNLKFDFEIQNFTRELADLPGKYAPPGCFLMAWEGKEPAGCVALRPLDGGVCEMKRLYVRPPFRGRGIGRALVEHLISGARDQGYRTMRLDTLPAEMESAAALYRKLGFASVEEEWANRVPGIEYMELDLRAKQRQV